MKPKQEIQNCLPFESITHHFSNIRQSLRGVGHVFTADTYNQGDNKVFILPSQLEVQ